MNTQLMGDIYVTMPDGLGGKADALVEASYSALVTLLNAASKKAYEVGQSIYIRTLDVPDIWISANNESTKATYTYTTDDAFIAAVNAAGGALQIGYHKVSFLEGSKVDLTNYLRYDVQSLTDQQKAQARTNIGAALAPSVKSSLDETLADGGEYRIGSVSSLALTLPSSGLYGIHIIFTASASFTPTVSGTYVGETVAATVSGKTYEYLFTWNGAAWVLSILYY